jgi:aspartate aminotransferase
MESCKKVKLNKKYVKPKKNYSPSINLNLNVRGLTESATLAINELSNQLHEQGRKIYKLGLGQSPFPVPKPVVDELKVNAFQKDYLHVQGLPQLRCAIANYIRRRQGTDYGEDDILIGPGSKELMFLLQLVYYGDLVIPTPSWVSYAPQAHILGRHVRWLSTHADNDWLLMPDELERICAADPERPRLVILNYPSNPTGRTYKVEELKALARVARKYRVILLSDEIYGELHHTGKHISIDRFYPEGTIISTGLSKWCGAGGWRLGTFIFPKSLNWLLKAMSVVASETFTSTSAPIQYAAVRAFEGGTEIEHYLWQSRRILSAVGKYTYKSLLSAGVALSPPQGAFYLFPDFSPFRERFGKRNIYTSEQFCKLLLESTGVAILPGTHFGRPQNELTARLAYVDFDGARALEAAEQYSASKPLDEGFLETYLNNTITAIDLLVSWLHDYFIDLNV